MNSQNKTSNNSSKKTALDESQHDNIKEKPYITREIETSITLLESPEHNIVLESLLFLSKYADIQRNNLNFVQSRGLLPKLLALLDHNICILRVSLRLLSQLLTIGVAQIELNQDKFDEQVLKICKFYTEHGDLYIKEFSLLILEKYIELGRIKLLLEEPNLIKAVLKSIKTLESEVILNSALQLFYNLIEIESVRSVLAEEENFKLDHFINLTSVSEPTNIKILAIFEKITYFNEYSLQNLIKENKVIEHILTLIVNPEKKDHWITCLNIIRHSMQNEITQSNFVQSLEFLQFCQWIKTCPEDLMEICARIFLDLSKIDPIRQLLFDLSIEDVILSFLRSENKKILSFIFDAICFMSRHKYCCEKVVTPIVIKKIIRVLSTVEDCVDDPYNISVLNLLFYLCRRDIRTLYMFQAFAGLPLLLKYLNLGTEKITQYKNLLDIVNMYVNNEQLQELILCPELYDVILHQTQNKKDDISNRCLEIMINCLNHSDFREYFLTKNGPQILVGKLANCRTDNRTITIFLHNAMMHEDLGKELVHQKLLLVLKRLSGALNPLILRIMNLIYNMCLPIKFFETGRLEFVDKISGRFYLMAGPWSEPFPFLEILELRQISTRTTIYVIDDCVKSRNESMCRQCYRINKQLTQSFGINVISSTSISSVEIENFINYGALSRDPYLPKYINKVKELIVGVGKIERKIQILADFIDSCLCGPSENCTNFDKLHSFHLHRECIKEKLGTNMIPIGYLRLGFHRERALLFKTLADQVYIPTTLVKGKKRLCWNEVALVETIGETTVLKMYVVDLMNKIGKLLLLGSRECNAYCDIL